MVALLSHSVIIQIFNPSGSLYSDRILKPSFMALSLLSQSDLQIANSHISN